MALPSTSTDRVRRAIVGNPRVAVVICSADPRRLERCLDAIDGKTAYANREIVVVQHGWTVQWIRAVSLKTNLPWSGGAAKGWLSSIRKNWKSRHKALFVSDA